ncbi:MAG: tryptophan 2,3-dioxygenase family protein [Planctomycetota bacterium]|nr:tryptophan 2,3-dioxygenase family protein [Planctomycetota bacterium]
MSERGLEPGIATDFTQGMTYADYLCLDQLLSAQKPLSSPVHHDEMLFIIQHQTSELWMKLVVHELSAAREGILRDDLGPVFKILARVKHIQWQLFNQWSVLETLTPSEYAQFRGVLGRASGFQSRQYRAIEFLLGNKDASSIRVHAHDKEGHAELQRLLQQTSVYDEFLRLLARRGYAIPADIADRDFSKQREGADERVVEVFKQIYDNPSADWEAYEMAEKLVDVEEQFQLWRFRHMKTVERIIGYKPGTGGSSGVAFLRRALDQVFFPELLEVRTRIGAPNSGG